MKILIPLCLALGVLSGAYAQTLPHTFVPNTTAKAGEVNANFQLLLNEIKTLKTRLAAAEAELNTLKSAITVTSIEGKKAVVFDGVNVHIRNGNSNHSTSEVNGLGNLIIGYHRASSTRICSKGGNTHSLLMCGLANGLWQNNQRSGSHNVIIGDKHDFTSHSGLIVGFSNQVNGEAASVTGGVFNLASGQSSSISGGIHHLAIGPLSSISGGSKNKTIGSVSSISGGKDNHAGSGGSSISGGQGNIADGIHSTVSGGKNNTASGDYSTVSGGKSRNATGVDDWRAGTLFETQ